MAQLLVAVEDGTEPEISGRDNLETIALCEAVFAAATEHRVTTVREFLRMTPDLRIQQAIVVADARGVRVAAGSDEFDAPEAERIAVLFGRRPAGVGCPLAHFACPFGKSHVAVVRVGGPAGFERRDRLPLPGTCPRPLLPSRRPVRDLRPVPR